jgi:lipoprotein LprG
MSWTRTAALILTASLALTGCAGQDDDDPVGEGRTPEEVMELAKETLDETSGVRIELDSDGLPDDLDQTVLVSAAGVGVHPASFEGELVGRAFGLTEDGDVIAIDGTVWLDLPILLGPGFHEIDPAEYGAPDPSQLIAAEGGLSDLFVETADLEEGEEIRGGDDNTEVLTEYSGTLTGDQVRQIIPSADGDSFEVLYQVTSGGELRSAEITGEFYDGTDDTTYTLTLTEYGTEQDISAP